MPHARITRRAALVGGGLAALLGTRLLLRGRSVEELDSVRRRAEHLAQRHRLRISLWGLPAGDSSTSVAQSPELIGGFATPLKQGGIHWALDGMEQSLASYPDGFYASLCPTIFVCGSLVFEGRPAGGTYGRDWILLVAPTEHGREVIEMTCRLGVHHEFSSIVWGRALALPERWATLLPPSWSFTSSNGEALDASKGPTPSPAMGFLSAYGATTPENDFNTYAETVFTQPARLLELAASHRTIAAKLALVIDTYVDLEPRMRDTFFRLGFERFIGASRELVPGGAGLSPVFIPSGELVEPE